MEEEFDIKIIQVTRGNKKVLKIESYRKKNEKKCIN